MPGDQEFVDSFKTDIFNDQVYVFTPNGDIKELPIGSTPLDFAYRIHTDIGHSCIGARVNEKLVPLNSVLKNGDKIFIVTSPCETGPSLDWLNPNLGYLVTASAKEKIRLWFRKSEKEENLKRGQFILDKELAKLDLGLKMKDIVSFTEYKTEDDLLNNLGNGYFSINDLIKNVDIGIYADSDSIK